MTAAASRRSSRLTWGALALFAAVGAWVAADVGGSELSTAVVGPSPGAGRKVVILLHGYGAPAEDLVPFAKELSASVPKASFVLPAGPHGFPGRAWLPTFTAASREAYVKRLELELKATTGELWRLIRSLRRRGVACGDIVLGGFSQGGRVAAETALRAPPGCALGGLVVLSGGGVSELPVPTGQGRLKVLVTHGTADEVVGFGTGQVLARTLAEAGHEVRFLEFQGAHQIPPVVRAGVAAFLRGEVVGAAVGEGGSPP